MDTETRQTIEQCVAAAHDGTASFGEQVVTLAGRGVESYRVDFRERTATYFVASGDSYRAAVHPRVETIGEAFDKGAIVAAIRGSQQGTVKYPEFVERAMQAGCVGYVVWIAGRHVAYFGRRGEMHVENFPNR